MNIAELEAMPNGTVLLDHDGIAWQRDDEGDWLQAGECYPFGGLPEWFPLPATILHAGSLQADAWEEGWLHAYGLDRGGSVDDHDSTIPDHLTVDLPGWNPYRPDAKPESYDDL